MFSPRALDPPIRSVRAVGQVAVGLRVLAVDDERSVLEDLVAMLRRAHQVDEVVVAGSGGEALRALAHRRFDAMFLDVRMPDLDGVYLTGLLRQFANPPAVVFVSAHAEGAVSAFEIGPPVLDYLLKPVSRIRIARALDRVSAGRAALLAPRPPRDEAEIIPVADQRAGTTRLLARSSILYVKAEGDYIRLFTDGQRFLLRGPLAEIERRWAEHGFVRVHRSFVVNLRRAVEIRPEMGGGATVVMSGGAEVPVARRHVADLRRRLRA